MNEADLRGSITRLLVGMTLSDDVADREQLHALLYREMRQIAGSLMRRERIDHTLQPTALVHEAWMKLVDADRVGWEGRAHFLGAASRAMRQVLVDHARSRAAAKRGGDWQRVTLTGSGLGREDDAIEIIALHEALDRFAEVDPRAAAGAEMRVFGGMTNKEIAAVQGVSPRTADNDWAVARLWLAREMSEETPPPTE